MTPASDAEADAKRLEYEAAADEWSGLPEVQCLQGKPGISTSGPAASACVDYGEMWIYFKDKDLSAHMKQIQPTEERTKGCQSLLCVLVGPPQLDKRLVPERDRVFAIAQCQLENDEARQVQMLTTLYKRLTASRLDCARYGHHWETIGFQGSDPATDLRGAGLLSLLNALFLVTSPVYGRLATDTYRLSLHQTQNFPFMVLSINVTRLALNALRRGVLNRDCNLRLAVMDVFSEYYACIMCEFHRRWKTQGKTITDSGNVLKELEHLSLKRGKVLRAGLRTYLSQHRPREVNPVHCQGGGDN